MTVVIGSTLVGNHQPAMLVAEVGINHNGDLELAKDTIAAAVEAGADSVKFQNYRAEDFVDNRSITYTYESQGVAVTESQYEMFKRYELSFDQLSILKGYADGLGVAFHSTPSSEAGIRDLLELNVPVLKNGSDFLGHLPLIKAMARSGLPTVLSTGMATLGEIDDAVRAFREAGGVELILLHCTSAYPTRPDEINLRAIPLLESVFSVPIGFSDHSWGTLAATGAVALGACWVEKHFTLDRKLAGPDHRFSSDPAEFRKLVDDVRTVEQNLGLSTIGPKPSEMHARLNYRLSCVAGRSMAADQVLHLEDVAFQRPGTGLPPALVDWIVGKKLAKPVARGAILSPDLFV